MLGAMLCLWLLAEQVYGQSHATTEPWQYGAFALVLLGYLYITFSAPKTYAVIEAKTWDELRATRSGQYYPKRAWGVQIVMAITAIVAIAVTILIAMNKK